MAGPTRDFWQNRFASRQTPWDRGAPSPQLLAWHAEGQLPPPGSRIAVPGCGAGYEVAWLAKRGYAVTGLDYAEAAVEATRALLAAQDHAGEQTQPEVLQADVLEWSPGTPLDAVYEQTCLCALHPDHWVAYATRLQAWLRPGGRLLALFMQAPRPGAETGLVEGPPYHCDINAMRALFPEPLWAWPRPPLAQVPHPMGRMELAVLLQRR
ncbi:TPMT family class I SAM-dependent methyltransferase [Aquabacterium sp. A7-Y]|uniref:methyltransferase domain-containing protein n=1 Tax=Aquabacterium sp. A7-Y TaxID=1349605 RepID=UPI00223D6320|nr:methyltransferase domain-containing protein [Aquabacterium sp. A7-Y]MCW7542069.1 TPMT family class I SAM-dependent methyltransferase [Aquabacterium sp. A7-Y]